MTLEEREAVLKGLAEDFRCLADEASVACMVATIQEEASWNLVRSETWEQAAQMVEKHI